MAKYLTEQDLIDLFHRKRDLEIKAVLLDQKLKTLQEEINQNDLLLISADTISEMYKDQPIKIVTLEKDPQQEPLFWRIFPLFKRGKDNLYSANVFKKVKGRAYGISVFREFTSVCLPYSYTKEIALTLGKEWVISHILPERETLYLEQNPNGSESQRSETTKNINHEPYKPKIDSYPKIYRPSQESDTPSK